MREKTVDDTPLMEMEEPEPPEPHEATENVPDALVIRHKLAEPNEGT